MPEDLPTDADAVVALDVGGTSIKAGLVAADGSVLLELRRPTGVEHGAAAVVNGIVDLAAELAADPTGGPAGGRTIRAVGLGVPGVVDAAAGIARYAANLGWHDVAFGQLIGDRLALPVALGHDVRNGALAEARWGAGQGVGSMYFVAIGTGIAGGLVVDGQVQDGASGQAGEVGHLVVRPGGPACGCGNRGCLETIASASRIALAYRARTGAPATAEQVAALVRSGDPAAQHVWTDAVDALADALTALTVLSDPARIVIGGGLSLAGATLLDPLRAALAPRLTFRNPPEVAVTTLGDRAGLLGAALRAWDLV